MTWVLRGVSSIIFPYSKSTTVVRGDSMIAPEQLYGIRGDNMLVRMIRMIK